MSLNIRFVLIFVILFSNLVFSQELIISGVVIDSDTKDPLPFATIGIRGTTKGTASNKDGRFVIRIPQEFNDSIFFISYVGYDTYQNRAGSIEENIRIELIQNEIMLDEVQVMPWSAWDFVKRAIDKIPENYLSEPFLTTSYYNEYVLENNVFLKFTEGIIETYNPAYGDTARIVSRLVQARRKDDLGSIEFMRNRLEKRLKKEQKKAIKKGDDLDVMTIDEAVLSATFGGPRMILRNDPIRDTASFLNPDLKKYYNYEIEGYTTYNNEQIIIIHFESRKALEHRKRSGSIFISLNSDAIVAINFVSRIIVPDAVRPLLFIAGLGVTDPELHAVIHYRPYNGKWYVNDLTIEVSSDLTDKNMFSKNQVSTFNLYQSLITTSIEQENVSKIPKEEQLNNWKPLEEQVEEDPDFWRKFDSARPDINNEF